MEDLSCGGVVTLEAPAGHAWKEDVVGILEVLGAYHPGKADYGLVKPLASRANLLEVRKHLHAASPRLQEFSEKVRQQLVQSVAAYIPSLGFETFDVNTRALLTYALSVCMGNPTATDTKRVIWDVKAAQRGSTYFSTFSETDREAAFHTDTQYYPDPEPLFFLYCMRPARCFGGMSSICDARALRSDIEKSDRWIADVLSHTPLPFRVPSAFVTSGDPDEIEATLAPVFAATPYIRYRKDTLAEGLEHFPEYGSKDVRRALEAFEERLEVCPHMVEFFMPVDGLVVVDNHRALHARTSFQDSERHLLRIRVNEDNPIAQKPQHRMVSRSREGLAF